MIYNTATLPCGLRIIHEKSSSPILYCGYVVCAGTRNEEADDVGMAHFIEHMSFKGTKRRRPCHIVNGLERVGGELNAYTTKQETVYYATVLREDFKRAADILTDIVFQSTYPQNEIEKEVEVICDEIESYKDSPSDLIFDNFEALMYPNQPLGRDILGNAKRLRQYTTKDALRFTKQWYRPANAVFYVYGDMTFSKIVKTLERFFLGEDCDKDHNSMIKAQNLPAFFSQPIERTVVKNTHQAHVLIGAPAFSGKNSKRYALILLNNLLGGPCMNSRLNLALREHLGLVYSVESYLNTYPDTGFWNVYFGCDYKDVTRCRRLLQKELQKFIEKKLTPTQLSSAKKQFIGQLVISTASSESYALAMGRTFAHYNIHRDINKLCEKIQAVTADEMQEVASEVYSPSLLSTLIYK